MPTLRHMEIVTDVDKLNVDLQQTFMNYKSIKEWAYIIHDKDDTRPHYHIYLNFGKSPVSTELVAKWFDIPENFINKVKGRKADMLLYLTHGNETQKNKHQYSPEEVVANFDFETEIENSKIIGNFEKYSYAQMLQYCNTLPIHEKAKTLNQLEKLWKLQCACASLNPHRDIKVVFVTGKGGMGKTYNLIKFFESLNYDICMSSSKNDIVQDYKGQKALILDDLRDEHIDFSDLLKVLDNNSQSSIGSRFINKVFMGEMIGITSSVPLKFWYWEIRSSRLEDLYQLYRRITCYIEVSKDEVKVYSKGLDENGNPVGAPRIYVNPVKLLKEKEKTSFDFEEAFDNLLGAKFVEVKDDEELPL